MKIKTDGKANFIKVEPGETLVVEFCPDGYNAHDHSHTVGFAVETNFTPSGKMGLTIRLPEDKTYRKAGNKLVLVLHDLVGYEKLAFKWDDDIVELERLD